MLYVLLVVTEDCTGDVVEERRSKINQLGKKIKKKGADKFPVMVC